ncbi:MAG: pimB 1 [Acidobacteria bacterium]|nr:pimB 1 [Acidobacteriota bacterium]
MAVQIHQVLATLSYGDAIGNEVLGIRRALQEAGYESEIFCATVDARLEDLTRDYRDLVEASRPENILIHHFSLGSRASRIAYALPDRMVLIYHNVTPPEYFVDIHPLLVRECYRGRRELAAYAGRCDLALGDSEFNRQELEAAGFPETAVMPVVPGFSHLEVPPDRRVLEAFDDACTNVIFVGRIVPNKRIEDVVRIFAAYQRFFNPDSRLLVVGSYSGFERYYVLLQSLVARLGARSVHFLGHVSNSELTACYDVADAFLCASEHEGFCVPLVEGFAKGIPVLAYAAAAVPATMDGAGVLYRTKDPYDVAALVDQVASNRRLADAIVEGQDAALERLLAKDFTATLLGFVDRVLASPRRPPHRVAPDFWQQVDATERCEELQQYRPALGHALPKEPVRVV